jgi:hypothetical protein
MGQINADWHRAHKMPKNPTEEQRLAWHIDHARNCTCRDMPPTLRALAEARGIRLTPPPDQ